MKTITELGHHARFTPVDTESKKLDHINRVKSSLIAAALRACPTATVQFTSHFMGPHDDYVHAFNVPQSHHDRVMKAMIDASEAHEVDIIPMVMSREPYE